MRPSTLLFSIAVSLLFFSCSSVKEEPVSKEEAKTMARQIDSAIGNNKPDYFIGLVNTDAFMQRVAIGSDLPSSKDLKKGIETGLKKSDLGAQIIRGVEKSNGGYELVKQYEKDKKQHLVYRFYGDDGLNYHDFELTKIGDKVWIADIFFYITGENFSKSLGDFVSNVSRESKVDAQDLLALNKMKELVAQDKHQEAKSVYDGLPQAMKNQKIAQVYNLTICSALDAEVYTKALSEFEVRFKHEPNMYLSLIDAYVLRKDFDKALEAINKIDAMINKDPYLEYYRYSFYTQLNKNGEAIQSLENLYKAMPHFGSGAIELIVNYLQAGEYEKARPVVAAYRENESFDQELLESNLLLHPKFSEAGGK